MMSKLLILFLILVFLIVPLCFITNICISANEKQLGIRYKILGGVNGVVLGMIAAIISHWIFENALINFWESIPVILFGTVIGGLVGAVFYARMNKFIANLIEMFLSA
jgi:hypothetical protein